MIRRKEQTMSIKSGSEARADPGGRRATRHAVAAATVAAALFGASAGAERSNVSQHGPPPELQRVRSKRWWLDPWGHSMQEQAFMTWMTATTGGVEWMYLMPTHEVHATYAWWLQVIWPGQDPPR